MVLVESLMLVFWVSINFIRFSCVTRKHHRAVYLQYRCRQCFIMLVTLACLLSVSVLDAVIMAREIATQHEVEYS